MQVSLSEAVQTIYSSVHQPDGWDRVLALLANLTGAGSGCIVSTRPNSPVGNVDRFHNIDPDWIAAYNAHYYQYDPTPELMQSRPGIAQMDHVTGPRPSQAWGARRTFYHEVMQPQCFRHTLALGLAAETGWHAGLIVQRSSHRGAFDDQAAKTLNQIAGHLRQALELHARMVQLTGQQGAMAAALNQSPTALVLVDANGGVVFANRNAENMLANTPVLNLSRHGLRAAHPADDKALQRLVRNAIATANGHPNGGGTMWFQGAIHVHVTPICPGEAGLPFAVDNVFAALWLSAPDRPANVSPAALREYYGLTVAESEVLRWFVQGKTPDQIAKLRSVTIDTLRSQLKAIKDKVGASRQTELVQAVLQGPALSMTTENGRS